MTKSPNVTYFQDKGCQKFENSYIRKFDGLYLGNVTLRDFTTLQSSVSICIEADYRFMEVPSMAATFHNKSCKWDAILRAPHKNLRNLFEGFVPTSR